MINVGMLVLFLSVLVGVMQKLFVKIGWIVVDVDLYEINEVFVVVMMVVLYDFRLLVEKVNIYGGVCVLGYLIGVFGVCIVVMLFGVLKKYGMKCGVVLLCIGGGEVMVLVVELI